MSIAGGLTVSALVAYLGFLPCMRRRDPMKQDIEKGRATFGSPMRGRPRSTQDNSSESHQISNASRETSEPRYSAPINGHPSQAGYRIEPTREPAHPHSGAPSTGIHRFLPVFTNRPTYNPVRGQISPVMDPNMTHPLQDLTLPSRSTRNVP